VTDGQTESIIGNTACQHSKLCWRAKKCCHQKHFGS